MTSKSGKNVPKYPKSPEHLALLNFRLPNDICLSDVSLPVLEKPNLRQGGWKQLSTNHDEWFTELQTYLDDKEEPVKKPKLFYNTEANFIQKQVFEALLPALEETLNQAKMWNAFERPLCFFNGIDNIAQLLWTNNTRHPSRKYEYNNTHIFNLPWAKKYLEMHPRPIYPKSWLWTEEFAATVIQRTYRRHLTLMNPEIQEMRDFWKKLDAEAEAEAKEMTINPIVLRKFASIQSKNVGFK